MKIKIDFGMFKLLNEKINKINKIYLIFLILLS